MVGLGHQMPSENPRLCVVRNVRLCGVAFTGGVLHQNQQKSSHSWGTISSENYLVSTYWELPKSSKRILLLPSTLLKRIRDYVNLVTGDL